MEAEGDIYTLTILSQLRDYEVAKYINMHTGRTVEEEEAMKEEKERAEAEDLQKE